MFYSNLPNSNKSSQKEKRKHSEAHLIYEIKQSPTTYYMAPAYFGFILITKQSHCFTTWKRLNDELPLKSQKQSTPDIILNNIR